MGFSVRKRTKGKSSWFNFSASKSRGANVSYSQKFGNRTTVNISKHGRRVTYNVGNGVRYTSYSKNNSISWVFIFIMIMVIVLLTL